MKHLLYFKRDSHSIAHLEHPFLPREVFFKGQIKYYDLNVNILVCYKLLCNTFKSYMMWGEMGFSANRKEGQPNATST
jgi:hypothetical protein